MTGLSGLSVIITGGLKGLGASILERLVKEVDIKIAIVGKEKNEETDNMLSEFRKKYCADVRFFSADIRLEDDIKQVVEKTAQAFGGIDICINAATVMLPFSAGKCDVSHMDISYQVNARSSFLLAKYSFDYLSKSEHGRVLNVTPPINLDPRVLSSKMVYSSSQYYKSMLTVALGNDDLWRSSNIAVNALWPLRQHSNSEGVSMYQAHTEQCEDRKTVDIFGDAAYFILCQDASSYNGEFFYDEEVAELSGTGVSKYSSSEKATSSNTVEIGNALTEEEMSLQEESFC